MKKPKIDFETKLCALLSGYLLDVVDTISNGGDHAKVTMDMAARIAKAVKHKNIKYLLYGIVIGQVSIIIGRVLMAYLC